MKQLAVIFFFVFSLGLQAQSLDVAELSIDTNYIRLGQQTVLKFSVTCSKDRRPVIPVWKDVLKDKLDIISEGPADTIAITGSQLKVRQELVVAKFNEDTSVIDSLQIPLCKNRDTLFVATNALKIYPVLEEVDMEKDIRDIKSPVDIPYDWHEFMPYIIGFIGLIVLGLLIWIIIRLVKRKRKNKVVEIVPEPPPVIIPAHLIALEKLELLRVGEKWLTTHSKTYITELTDILREYIFNRWGFDARESTSEEILSAGFIAQVDPDHLRKLKEILGTADYVKFAKANTSTDENRQMLEKATGFVEITQQPEEDTKEGND